jgi:hypothetical protein
MDSSLSEALRVIEREAEREGIQLTRPARLILVHLAESGGEAVVAKLWRVALDRARPVADYDNHQESHLS